MSRNKQEGRYAGRVHGQHFRSNNAPTGLYVGDELLFAIPAPSLACAFALYVRRKYPARKEARTPQQVKDAYRALHWEDAGEKKSPAALNDQPEKE